MKRMFVILAVTFALPYIVNAQDIAHAPTADVCRADVAVWTAELAEAPKGSNFPKPELRVISMRHNEMKACRNVDPDRYADYEHLLGVLDVELRVRLEHFIERHHLTEQLVKEDSAGAR